MTQSDFPVRPAVSFTQLGCGCSAPLGKANPQGWNLIGNPYPAALDADLFLTFNGANLDATYGALYFWDDADGNNDRSLDYATYTLLGGTAASDNSVKIPNGLIALGQAFFVKAKDATVVEMVFNPEQRIRNTNSQFFIPELEPISRFNFGINNPDNHYNEILIGFTDQATWGVDPLWDARKLKGNPNIALFSLINNDEYAIQALPRINQDVTVDIGFDAATAGTHNFTIARMENMNTGNGIYLEDRYLQTVTNLLEQPEYNFHTEKGTYKDRFRLIFTYSVTLSSDANDTLSKDNNLPVEQGLITNLNNDQLADNIKVYAFGNSIMINSSIDREARVLLIDPSGKIISDTEISLTPKSSLNAAGLSKGIYILKIMTEGKSFTEKVVLQ